MDRYLRLCDDRATSRRETTWLWRKPFTTALNAERMDLAEVERSLAVLAASRDVGGSSRVEVDDTKGKRRRKSCGKKVMKTDVARGREVCRAEHWIIDASLKSWSDVTSTANGGFKQVRVWREDLIASLVALLSATYLGEPCTGEPHPHGDDRKESESLTGTTAGIASRRNGETPLLTHARVWLKIHSCA